MNSQRQPASSYFGPRRRTSTRLGKPESRFRTKAVMQIDKECRQHRANMKCMKSNHNVYDSRVNVVTQGAHKISSKDSNIGPSKHASQPTTLRRENSLNPSSSNLKRSKPSRVRNGLPLKIQETCASSKSKEDPNTIPGHPDQSRIVKAKDGSCCNRESLKAMPNLIRKAKNGATSNLNNGALDSRWMGKSNSYQGQDMNTGKDVTKSELLKSREVSRKSNIPVGSQLLGPNKDDPNKTKGGEDKVVTKGGMKGHTCNGTINYVKSMRRKQPLLEEKASTHGGNDSGSLQKDRTCRPMKRRRYIEPNKDEEDNGGNQHMLHVEDVTVELMPQVAISKLCVERQCHCCSLPIDIPRWSGILKIDGLEYISLSGHLSSKSCEKVWQLSSLPKVVKVTKVPRLAVWPKIFKASKPSGDNIGLYFFPPEMRHDEKLEQLVNEVMDRDLVLQAAIDDAEMLIFPSVLLPERYQTFKKKHYLWAAFNTKEDKGAIIGEQVEEKEKHVSNQIDEVQAEEPDQEMLLTKSAMLSENLELPANSIQEVQAFCVQGPTNMCLEHESPEERRLRDSLCPVSNAATVPTGATLFTTDTTFPANHGLSPSMEAPPRSSSIFGIVVRQAPDLELEVEQFIREMERKGALVTVMKGEAIGAGQYQATA